MSEAKHIRRRRTALALVLGALLALLAGCSQEGLPQGPGGMPPAQMARLSLVVAQTRAQFPSLSGADIPYRTRKAPPEGQPAPEPALFGEGTGIQRGIQSGERPRVRLQLYLDKSDYARGHARVTLPDGTKETWPVVAFDQRGAADERFDFAYLLADPRGLLRYLVVIGGPYEADGQSYVGYEGTLVEPGPSLDLETWRLAYKVDFGYRFPATPEYQQLVRQADDLFKDMRRRMDRLERVQTRTQSLEQELVGLRARDEQGEAARRTATQIESTQAQLTTEQNTRGQLVSGLDDDLVTYFELRRRISNAYAAFVQTNRYRWQDLQGQRDFYDAWKTVELHHPEIDKLVERFRPFTAAGDRIQRVRQSAMAVIIENNNWDKYPGGQAAGSSPRR